MGRNVVLTGALVLMGQGCVYDWSLPAASASTDGSSVGTTSSDDDTSGVGSTTVATAGMDVPEVDGGGKWFKTAALKVGSEEDNFTPVHDAARFDLLIVSPRHDEVWGTPDQSSWAHLKALNPDLEILLFVYGPTVYDEYFTIGDPWSWIVENHGLEAADRWTQGGALHPDLYPVWSSHHPMHLGNPAWRAYYLERAYEQLAAQAEPDGSMLVDGLYLDGHGYALPVLDEWEVEVSPGVFEPDWPGDYHDGTNYDHERHRADVDAFLDEAIPWLQEQEYPARLGLRFQILQDTEDWQALAQRAAMPHAAFSASGIWQQWGDPPFNLTNFDTNRELLEQLDGVPLIHGNQGSSEEIPGSGLGKMEQAVTTNATEGTVSITGWEALWLAICGHMALLDATRDDTWFYFSIWGHNQFFWFDEYDPAYLHLGEAVGPAFDEGQAIFREYEDGWVVFNPRGQASTGLAVPSGSARVIDHFSLHDPESSPLVQTFDLGVHRGVVLLKEGAVLGNGQQ